jgi:hypothetical protein
MERARIIHYVRITVTALSLTACVLLLALWVRSCWWIDYATLQITGERLVRATSAKQRIILSVVRPPLGVPHRWSVDSNSIAKTGMTDAQFNLPKFPGFSYGSKIGWVSVIMPHWCPVLVSATLAVAPWLKWSRRFSLRTLLIAATLAAVGLGLIVLL